jgi:hypothetical protein
MSRFKRIASGCGLALISTAFPALAPDSTHPSPTCPSTSIGYALTDCLHIHRLPVFEARVPADTARRMILYGFVANASGKAGAVESVRSTKEKVANNGKANCAARAKRAG